MNIVLVALYRYQNISIRTLHSLLENIDDVAPHTIFLKNCETNLFAPVTKKEEDLFIQEIIDLNPKIVGISVLSPYASVAERLTELIKEKSSALVIWGGIHPTTSPEPCINLADIVCVGEGEEALKELAICLRDEKPYQNIKNLWVRNGENIFKNPMRPLIQDLDSLPFPSHGNKSLSFIDSNRLTKSDPTLLDDYIYVLTSRGCPYVCSYCVNSILRPMFKGLGRYTRRRSVNNVIEEIHSRLSIKGNISDYIIFIDEVFGTKEKWLDQFVLRYKKEIGMPFWLQYNPKNIKLSALGKLVDAGLDVLSMGIETGSDYIRNHIFHRPGKINEIISFANEAASFGVKIRYNLIIDNPYETEDSLKETIEVLLALPKKLSLFNLFSLQYFPGYVLTEKAIEDEHIQPEEASQEALIENATKKFVYSPKLFPYTKKQIFQNIIWLIVWKRANDRILRYAVFSNSSGSKLCLIFLNFVSIALGKVLGQGKFIQKNRSILYFLNGLKYIVEGNWRVFLLKLNKHIKRALAQKTF